MHVLCRVTVEELHAGLLKASRQETYNRFLKTGLMFAVGALIVQTAFVVLLTLMVVLVTKDTSVQRAAVPGVGTALTERGGPSILSMTQAKIELPLYVAPILSREDLNAINDLTFSYFDDELDSVVVEHAVVLSTAQYSDTSAE